MSRQFTRDFFLEIAKGDVAGHSAVLKFGENPDIDALSGFEDIWDGGGTYVPPTQARIHDVVSSNEADAGTVVSSGTATDGSGTTLIDSGATFQTDGVVVGNSLLNDTNMSFGIITAIPSETELTIAATMREVMEGRASDPNESGDSYRVVADASSGVSIFHLEGLDASFLEQQEFVVLNGTSNVATVSSYIRQFRARVFGDRTGVKRSAVGTITSTAQADGTITCQVVSGNNQTLMAIYTIPSDKTGYLYQWWGSISKKQSATANLKLRVGTIDGIGYVLQSRSITTTGDSSLRYEFSVRGVVPGAADIWIESDSDANDIGVAAGFDVVLVEDGL